MYHNANMTPYERDPDTFDLRSSLLSVYHAVRLNRMLVTGCVVMTLALVTAYVIWWPPVYETTAKIMVERDADPVRDTFYVGWNVFRKDDARTEIELMTSAPTLLAVIEKENLRYEEVYHPPMSHLTYLWEQSAIGKTYRRLKASLLGAPPEAADPKLLERVRTAVDLHQGIVVEPIAESNAGRVTVKGPLPNVAKVANSLIDTYLEQRINRLYDEAKRSYDVLTIQMRQARDALKIIEDRRLAFLNSHGLMFDLQKESGEVSKLSDLEQSIAANRTRVASMEASLTEIERALQSEPRTLVTGTLYETNGIRESTKMKRRELEMQMIQIQDRYQPDSPEVQDLKRQLAQLDALIAASSERVEKGTTEGVNAFRTELLQRRTSLVTELAGAKAGLAVVEQNAAALRSRLLMIPTIQNQLRGIDREYGLAQEKYQQILSKQTQAAVSLTTTRVAMPSMRVVEYAMPPTEKSQPKTKILYPAGLVAGLFLGVFAAVAKTQVSGRLRRDQVEGGRANMPYYGSVPAMPAGRLEVLPRKEARR